MLPHLTFRQALVPLLLLGVFLVWRGIVPAWERIDTDFPNYYVAGRIVAEGGPAERLYDDAWFQEQIALRGIDQQGKFSPFPPPTALLFVPLAPLEPLTALRVMTVLNILLLAAAVAALARATAARVWESALVILLSGIGLANCFRFGQIYIALSLSIVLGFLFHRSGRPVLAGMMFGLLLPVKYFAVFLLVYYLWLREWKLTAAALATAGAIVLMSIGILGWEVHRQFLTGVAGDHLRGVLTLQDPFTSTFQSFDSLLRRLFVAEAGWNPEPVADLPVLLPLVKGAVAIAVVVAIAAAARRVREAGADRAGIFALLGIGGLLLSPASATYHMLLLWLPAVLMIGSAGRLSPRAFWTFLAAYTLIGFIPYRLFSALDGRGLLTLFAYPRLWLLVLLFIGGAWIIRGAARPKLREAN